MAHAAAIVRFALCALGAFFATAGNAMGAEVDLPRFPSVSPDGERVAFSWRGDLWVVSREGGQARRLTSHPANETRSVWSPDGGMIAFESDRDGPRALYVMDDTGAGVRRVSLSDDSLRLTDWVGDHLHADGRIEGDVYRAARPYRVSVAGGEPERVHDAFGHGAAGHESHDLIVFERGGSATSRRHYRGPDDRDLYVYDPADSSFERLTSWEGNDFHPAFRDDETVLYLSDREDMTVNLYAMDLGGGEERVRRLTNHTDRDVTGFGVSADGRTVVYTKWDGLYAADFTGDRLRNEKRLRIHAAEDAVVRDELMDVSRDVDEAALSPDGKTLAVVAMGDVYVRAVKEGAPTRRVTRTTARERDIAWSPDNTTLYFVSDSDTRESVYAATVLLTRDEVKERFGEATGAEQYAQDDEEDAEGEDDERGPDDGDDGDDREGDEDEKKDEKKDKGPSAGERWADALRFEVTDVLGNGGGTGGGNGGASGDGGAWEIVRDPTPSPDGKKLAFRATRGDVKILDLKTGDVLTLQESWDFGTEFIWSPDSRWIAFAQNDNDFNTDIFITPADGSGPAVNITRHPDNDYAPRWSADGRVLAFLSQRINDQYDAWLVFLDRDMEAMTPAELEDYFERRAKAVKKLGAIDPPSEDPDDADGEGEAETKGPEPAFTREDLETAYLRLRRVTSYDGNEGSLAISGDGSRVVVSSSAGPQDGGLFSVKWDGSDAERLTGGASVQHVTRDGQTLVLVSGGRVRTVPVAGGKTETHEINAEKRVDHAALSAQKFGELSRELGLTFYHPQMKGLDWDALTSEYKALAVRAHTPDEFAWVASRFLGELNASHLGVYPRGGWSAGDYRPSGALGVDTRRVEREGPMGEHAYEVTRVLPLSPTQAGDMAIAPGDVILMVDFEPFAEGRTLDTALAGKTGEEVVVTVEREIDGRTARLDLLRTPISGGAENRLRYDDWQRSRARLVDEWSGGRIGYLHIRSMGGADLVEFERDLFAAAEGKEGLLIDVRSNGGGWTTDRVLASIMYTPHAYTIPRGADPEAGRGYPRDRLFIQKYNLPINMICNEKSFSNAEIISHAFKTLGRGTLVGEETYGGVISTGGFRLQDGTFVRRPFRGWYLPDGTDMENHGAMPDVRVPQTPEDEAAGRDRQLRAAVENLLQRID